jgi:DNA recombination protein RmuC
MERFMGPVNIILAVLCAVLIILALVLYRRFLYWKFKSSEWETAAQNYQTQIAELQVKVFAGETQNQTWQSKFFQAEAQAQSLERMSQQMKDSFQALAHQTLEGQTKQFLELAQQTLSKHTELAQMDLSQRQTNIDAMLTPLKQTLESVQKQTAEMEKERQKSYNSVANELQRVVSSSQQLSLETRSLKDALKKPHIRGRWGEVQLRNCVELAGMSEFADVTFQDLNTVDDGRTLIPDMTVKMPGGRIVIVDAKTPLDGFIASLEATTEEQRNMEMKRHGMQVKEHVKKLSQKAYNEHLANSADFTVMFLPNESFLYAALETQADLIEFALEKKILIATPPTFVGLLKVVRYGWNEDRLAKTAEQISEVGRELHKRVVDFVETFLAIGKSLDTAQNKYDEGLKRLNSRVIVQAKKMEKLGAKSAKNLPDTMIEEDDDEGTPLLSGTSDTTENGSSDVNADANL